MKKALLVAAMFLCFSSAWAAMPPQGTVKGEVLEVRDVESYTYLLLKTDQGRVWAAVSRASLAKGDKVELQNAMVMKNFKSRTLGKTFPSILFARLADSTVVPELVKADAAQAAIAPASGENAQSIGDVVNGADALKDKSVRVRGKVMKFNAAIMGKNWIHLQDGSGLDLLVTSAETVKVGEVVTMQGVVRTDRDFGAGYTYKVVLEEAVLQAP